MAIMLHTGVLLARNAIFVPLQVACQACGASWKKRIIIITTKKQKKKQFLPAIVVAKGSDNTAAVAEFMAAHTEASRVAIPTPDGQTLDAIQMIRPIAEEDAPWVRFVCLLIHTADTPTQ